MVLSLHQALAFFFLIDFQVSFLAPSVWQLICVPVKFVFSEA